MQQTKDIMGMHVTVEVKDGDESKGCDLVFDYLHYVDAKFSTYKPDSEISKINRKEISASLYSKDMQEIFNLAEQTKKDTQGYFDIQQPNGLLDPSGIVKGWAIWQASLILEKHGYQYFFIDAGGDIQARVIDPETQSWTVGIRNPFNLKEIIKIVHITNEGVATSGNYERGDHIYNPHNSTQKLDDILSLTVIGPNIYEADRYATAAFAMGRAGINFIESIESLEGYMIDNKKIAVMTSNFDKYVTK